MIVLMILGPECGPEPIADIYSAVDFNIYNKYILIFTFTNHRINEIIIPNYYLFEVFNSQINLLFPYKIFFFVIPIRSSSFSIVFISALLDIGL